VAGSSSIDFKVKSITGNSGSLYNNKRFNSPNKRFNSKGLMNPNLDAPNNIYSK
jgi:hypothetical protein